jgi:Ca2+-binding EF-hand superfamily protein
LKSKKSEITNIKSNFTVFDRESTGFLGKYQGSTVPENVIDR